MSSSDEESRAGIIFMGPTQDREITLERLHHVTHRDVSWNEQTEAEYMDRVKARATARVRALLLQARQRGEEILREAESSAQSLRSEAEAVRAEAEQSRNALMGEAQSLRDEAAALRDAARSEGYEEGRARADAELAEARQGLAETTALVLLGIHEQCGHIYEAWRDDLAALLREAVEKATSLVVDRDRAALLEELLDRSMRALLDRRRLIVRVNPVDAELVTDMLADAKRGGPHVESWELSTDSGLEPGSLVVESESGLVNNSRGVRRSVVDEVLERLTLPSGRADEEAHAAFTETLVREMRAHGVDLREEEPDGQPEKVPAAGPAEGRQAGESTKGAGEVPEVSGEAPAQAVPQAAPKASASPGTTARKESRPTSLSGTPSDAAPSPQSAPSPGTPAGPPRVPEAPPAESVSPAPAAGAESAEPAPDVHTLSEAEARDMVREFLGTEGKAASAVSGAAPSGEPAEEGLPPDVADELLADMGFGPDSHEPGAPPEHA